MTYTKEQLEAYIASAKEREAMYSAPALKAAVRKGVEMAKAELAKLEAAK